MNKEKRLVRMMQPTKDVAGAEMILPNTSGDHVKGIKRQVPVGNADLVNKAYVDAQVAAVHARQHAITQTLDHTSTATSGQMLKADANGLPVNATNTDAQVSATVTATHARSHAITSTSDHTSTATSGQMLKADANGLPVNATNTDAQVSATVTASHANTLIQHAITLTTAHTSTATSGQVLKADANGLPVNATNTDAQVSGAVTHAGIAGGDSVHVSVAENTAWDAAKTHADIAGGNSVHVSVQENTDWDEAHTHVTNNTQAHTDYMLNTGDTASGDYAFDTNVLFVDATNDRVGIGTATPYSRLDLGGIATPPTYRGDVRVFGGTATSNGGVEFSPVTWANGYGWRILNPDEGSGLVPLTFSSRVNNVAWTERVRFTADGKVGIGTASPATSATLEIASTTGALLVSRMTTTQRDALTAVYGMIIYNSTTNTMQGYINGGWANL